MSQIIVVKDSANNKLRELESNSLGELKVAASSLPLPSGAASEATLGNVDSSTAALNLKVTACDTNAVAVVNSALPSGAATEVSAAAAASSLSTLAGAVSLGVVQVSAGAVASSASTVYSAVSIAAGATTKSSSFDVNAYRSVCIFGTTDNTNDSIEIEVSNDNSSWYELNNHYISVDYSTGDFGLNMDISARYIRLSKSNNSGISETINAIISAK